MATKFPFKFLETPLGVHKMNEFPKAFNSMTRLGDFYKFWQLIVSQKYPKYFLGYF